MHTELLRLWAARRAVETRLREFQERFMPQYEELKQAIAEHAAAEDRLLERVQAKIQELGDPDPDLSADIEAFRQRTQELEGFLADADESGGETGEDTGGGEPPPGDQTDDGGLISGSPMNSGDIAPGAPPNMER